MNEQRGEADFDILSRLESGESPETLGLDAAGLVAAIADATLAENGGLGPSLVHSSPTHRSLLKTASEPELARLLPRSARPGRLALAAGLLQALDFWEESHQAAQEANDLGESRFSPYWHAIAHRREPDPGNAGYWFRRVGKHPVFASLAEAARPLLNAHGDPALTDRLLKGGAWDPMAFVAFCGSAPRDSRTEALGRRIQAAEMRLLLDATASALS